MFTITTAAKEKVKLMVGLTGPSGAGKTYSALQLAYGITKDWSKIALADTENRSGLYYAGEKTGPWTHIDFPSTIRDGYHPANWVALINKVETLPGIEVLVLDSITHEWQGEGGCLQLLNRYSKDPKKNSYTSWNDVTPLHNSFVDKIRNSRLHVISTIRSKIGYATEKNESTGRMTPKKIGMEPIQRDGIEYEFGVIFDIDITHYAQSSKDRTGLFANRAPFVITPDVGQELVAWTKSDIMPSADALKIIKAFEKYEITEMNLESYCRKNPSQWDKNDYDELLLIGKDFKEGKKDKESFLEYLTLRDQ